ncbi:unnamed protein product [Mytilus coruscus]|uniref:TRIM71 n=1 Tax=Mytilus coruscus TaxID=42192 RepID=A0A6J7ZVE8_MYTCO|nr:unnamed protein product [Mytilus coruscus]
MKKKQMEEAIRALQDQQTKLKKAIHSNHAGTIFTATSELTESVPNYSFDAQSSDIIDFTQGETTLKKIVDLFGLLRHKEESIIDFKVLKSYTTDFSFVDTVLTTDDKTALISNPTVKIVRQITTSEKLKTLKQISVKIFDMASTSNNEILMSMFGSPDVKLLKPTGQFQQFMSVSPLFPLAVHVTKSNEVLIGVKDEGENFSLTHNSIRKILTFGMDGKQRRSYEYVGQKQRLFTLPYSIKTYHNGNILTIDRTSKIGGRVVTIGKDGKLKWIYNGNISINTRDTPFNPHDIVITTMGYIIVADNNTNAFHVLSGNGELLTCRVMKDQGISIPNALDIDNTGQLWVGCCADKGKTNAKLHIVKIL